MVADGGQTPLQVGSIERTLERLEILTGQLGLGIGREQAHQIPQLLQQVADYLETANPEAQGTRMVQAGFSAYSSALRKNLSAFLRELRDPGSLAARRPSGVSAARDWWWFPAETLAADRKAALLRFLRTASIVAAVLLAAWLVYLKWFQPDPKVLLVMDTREAASQLLAVEMAPAAALARIDQGLTEVPDDGELLSIKSAVLIAMGREQEAEPVFREAVTALGDEQQVLATRAQFLSVGGYPSLAERDARSMIANDKGTALGYMLLGQALEFQKQYQGALEAYETASTLGMESGDTVVAAQSRIKMGYLMQQMQAPIQ